jgi:hypothetical protein
MKVPEVAQIVTLPIRIQEATYSNLDWKTGYYKYFLIREQVFNSALYDMRYWQRF